MSATSVTPKNAQDYIPYCADQGMRNLVGTYSPGVSVLSFSAAMPGGGVIALPATMANTSYQVFVHNHTGAVQGTVAAGDRAVDQITVTGPTAADELDIMVVGQLDGQLA